jgi:hypothetical protein
VIFSPFSPPTSETDAEDNREEQDLQHVVARQRVKRGSRDDVDKEGADATALQLVGVIGIGVERLGVERRRIDVHAVAGAKQIGEQKADDQRHRGHGFEIDQRLDADPPDLFEVPGAGNAVHDHAEHDGCYDHRDQLEEGVAVVVMVVIERSPGFWTSRVTTSNINWQQACQRSLRV